MKLEVTEQEVQVIGAGLMKLPFEVAAPLLEKLQKQVNDQLKPAEVKNENEAGKEKASQKDQPKKTK